MGPPGTRSSSFELCRRLMGTRMAKLMGTRMARANAFDFEQFLAIRSSMGRLIMANLIEQFEFQSPTWVSSNTE